MERLFRSLTLTIAIIILTMATSVAAEPFTVVNAQKLKAMMDDKETVTVVIDSRSRDEYDQAHITGAISLPLALMTAKPGLLGPPSESKLVFYCSGST